MNLEANCPKCGANLHRENFYIVELPDEEEFDELNIECWQCTWTTQFKVKLFQAEAE